MDGYTSAAEVRPGPDLSGQNLVFSHVPSQTRVANHFAVAPSVHGVPHLHGSMRLAGTAHQSAMFRAHVVAGVLALTDGTYREGPWQVSPDFKKNSPDYILIVRRLCEKVP